MAQVVECLPSKHKTLSSNPSITKKKRKQKDGRRKKMERERNGGRQGQTEE
jgi:hypothetical protein